MSLASRWEASLAARSGRERALVGLALAALLLCALWWLAIAPALSTLRNARVQSQALQGQWQEMQRLQAQARALQAQPSLEPTQARVQLDAAIAQLGPAAQASVQGDRVLLTLRGLSADALAQWLAQVRVNARTVPQEVRLSRGPDGLWSGSLALPLPSRTP